MTGEERENQRRSFVYGNTKLADDFITKQIVDDVGEAYSPERDAYLKRTMPWLYSQKSFEEVQYNTISRSSCTPEELQQSQNHQWSGLPAPNIMSIPRWLWILQNFVAMMLGSVLTVWYLFSDWAICP